MMKIILASHNQDKLEELKRLLAPSGIDFVGMAEIGFDQEIEENGQSYKENAYLKAKAVHDYCQCPVLADDTGLSVDLLDGAPGLYTARFAGLESSYDDKIEALWQLLKPYPVESWTASFNCVLCFIDEREYYFSAQIKGLILPEKRGEHGFGYDPVFYLPERDLTTAQMLPEEKNKISHRGQAMAKFLAFLAGRQAYAEGE